MLYFLSLCWLAIYLFLSTRMLFADSLSYIWPANQTPNETVLNFSTGVTNQHKLYLIIGDVDNCLMSSAVGTPDFIHDIDAMQNGFSSVVWCDDSEHKQCIKLMDITENMASTPYLIAYSLITLIYQWYGEPFRVGHPGFHRQSLILRELISLLDALSNNPQMGHFERLYHLLQFKLYYSSYRFLFGRLFYDKFVDFISNGTLSFIRVIGEGGQAVVLKVGSTKFSQSIALKMYKDYGNQMHCIKEEYALQMITRYNEVNPETRLSVPALIPSVGNISINCNQHRSFLMQFIDGMTVKQRKVADQFTTLDAVDMYSQLQPTLERLHRMGIGHRDVSEANVIMENKTFWLLDFGFCWCYEGGYAPPQSLSQDIEGLKKLVNDPFLRPA